MSPFLIVGLGNPGSEYADTRHNIGFRVVEALAAGSGATWTTERLAERSEATHRGRRLILLKPTTYMNLSGKAVAYHLQANKLLPDRLLVITDDLALPYGTLRLRAKGSDGGHNGLKDITAVLGHSNYARIRVGIGAGFGPGQQVDYVLAPFSAAEREHLPAVIAEAAACVQSYAFSGLNMAMNRHNRSVLPAETSTPPSHTSAAS